MKKSSQRSGRSQTRNVVPEESIESDGELVVTACSFQSRALVMSRQKTDSVKYSKINNKAIKNNKKLVELKSGFLDKPMSQVVIKHKWPHMNQNPQYITKALT